MPKKTKRKVSKLDKFVNKKIVTKSIGQLNADFKKTFSSGKGNLKGLFKG